MPHRLLQFGFTLQTSNGTIAHYTLHVRAATRVARLCSRQSRCISRL